MMPTLKWLIAPLWIITLAAVACMKQTTDLQPQPEMHYTYPGDLEIKPNTYSHIDIDGNGTTDFTFYTQLVGDAVLKRDRLQFMVSSKIDTKLLNDSDDESPRLEKGAKVGLQHDGFQWFEVSFIVLAEKIIPLSQDFYWDGMWKNAYHHFLPVQVVRENKPYYGWIEISFDRTNQKLILHKTGISTVATAPVKAGY